MNRNVNTKAVVAVALSFLFFVSSVVSYAVGGTVHLKALEGWGTNALGEYITQDNVHHQEYLICHAGGQYPCEIDYLGGSGGYDNIYVGNWTLDSMDSYSPPLNTVTYVRQWIGERCTDNPGTHSDCVVDNSAGNGVGGPHRHMIYGGVAPCSGLKDHLKTVNYQE